GCETLDAFGPCDGFAGGRAVGSLAAHFHVDCVHLRGGSRPAGAAHLEKPPQMTLGRLLTNLLLTVVLEGGALWVFSRDKKLVWYSFLCNLLTNPAANLLMALLVLWQGAGVYLPALVCLELLV